MHYDQGSGVKIKTMDLNAGPVKATNSFQRGVVGEYNAANNMGLLKDAHRNADSIEGMQKALKDLKFDYKTQHDAKYFSTKPPSAAPSAVSHFAADAAKGESKAMKYVSTGIKGAGRALPVVGCTWHTYTHTLA